MGVEYVEQAMIWIGKNEQQIVPHLPWHGQSILRLKEKEIVRHTNRRMNCNFPVRCLSQVLFKDQPREHCLKRRSLMLRTSLPMLAPLLFDFNP